jgi:hypothetical protein
MNFEEFHARPSVQTGPAAGEIAAQTIGKEHYSDEEHDGESVEEKCFSSTEKSPASAIFGRNFGFDVDFGA